MGDRRLRIAEHDVILSGRVIRMARMDGDQFRFIKCPEEVLASLRNSRTRIDLFTFMQRLSEGEPRYQYSMEWDNQAVLEIKSFDHWWNEQIGFKARNKAKQAEKKGVVIREVRFDDSLVRGIWKIYNETPIRQGRKFFHYGKTFEVVKKEASTFLECSVFVGAFFEDNLIGFVKLTIDETGTQAGLMHIISMMQHREKSPMNGLIAHAVRVCSNRGIRYLAYAQFAYGNKTHDSLSDFKERNGFERIDVPRYYIPLTPVGQFALNVGLHLGAHHHLPEGLIATLRKYRAAWYGWKYPMSMPGSTGSKAKP